MCILSLLAPGHTDSQVSGLCSGVTTTNWFHSSEVLHTDLGFGSCCLCLCPPPAFSTVLEHRAGKQTCFGGDESKDAAPKGWSQLIFLSTVYRGSKAPSEYFVLTRIENGARTAPVGPGFWVNASVAPSNFHFAWFQDLLHFHNNFCMGPFVMSRQYSCFYYCQKTNRYQQWISKWILVNAAKRQNFNTLKGDTKKSPEVQLYRKYSACLLHWWIF